MALTDYRRLRLRGLQLCRRDPVAAWREQSARQEAVSPGWLQVSSLRILGEDTDLTVDVSARPWINADGRENLPDGEVYTSPLELATDGHIAFTLDAPFNGTDVARRPAVVRERPRRPQEATRATPTCSRCWTSTTAPAAGRGRVRAE